MGSDTQNFDRIRLALARRVLTFIPIVLAFARILLAFARNELALALILLALPVWGLV